MNKILLLAMTIMIIAPTNAYAEQQMCNVEVCNKLKRFSLSPWSHIKDAMGESCYDIQLPEKISKEGHQLDNSTRWYQGSFNPTKRTVTYVKQVYNCDKVEK